MQSQRVVCAAVLGSLFLLCLVGTRPLRAAELRTEEQAAFETRGKRVVFLGDSITHAGHFISLLEGGLRAADGDQVAELINLGLPSETCTGLSEPDHPFPRPNVHERLQRALDKTKPDIVVACYGMNDGIYYPFSDERFAKYQSGIDSLIATVKKSGAKLVLMTPPPFDPEPFRRQKKLLPKDAEKFAWFAIYEDYDAVMSKYAQWIREQKDRVDLLIDLRTPMTEYMGAKRRQNPKFTLSNDGVHINIEGHRVLAKAILAQWVPGQALPGEAVFRAIDTRQKLLAAAWLSHVGHVRTGVKKGLPLDEAVQKAKALEEDIRRLVKSGSR